MFIRTHETISSFLRPLYQPQLVVTKSLKDARPIAAAAVEILFAEYATLIAIVSYGKLGAYSGELCFGRKGDQTNRTIHGVVGEHRGSRDNRCSIQMADWHVIRGRGHS